MKIKTRVGNIPEPDDLIGRDRLLDRIWGLLPANNILLLAPRRFGKSGVMRHMTLKPRAGFAPVPLEKRIPRLPRPH